MELKFELLEKQYPDTLILQLQGSFYKAFNNCAFVLANLMDYKLKESSSGYKCGFPITAFEKVENECKKNHINYVFFDGEKCVAETVYEDNQFASFSKMYGNSILSKIDASTKTKKKKERIIQKINLIDGCGLNMVEALNDLKNNIEKEILMHGYKIVSLSILEKDKEKNLVQIQGVIVYE